MKPTAATAGPWRPIADIPETFQARGVAVHLTTPELAGARVRPGSRGTIELAINNPSGGRGIYVLPWESVFAFSTPTIHDRALMTAIRNLAVLSPATVRSCALAVAAEGSAGSAAGAATMQALRPRFRSAAAAITALPGLRAEAVVTAFEEIADEFAAIGVRDFHRQARVQAAVAAIRTLRRDLARSAGGVDSDGSVGNAVRQIAFICAAAEHAAAAADAASGAAHALAAAPPELVRAWLHDSRQVGALAARSAWLIDGWERICLLWRLGGQAADVPGVLDEMTALVPVLPAEADGWPGVTALAAAEPGWRVQSVGLADAPAACGQDGIARNEQIRALAA